MEKVAVVGCGYWGKNLTRTFNKLNVLKAVCDLDVMAAQQQADIYNVKTATFQEILLDESIETVAIAVPSEQHFVLAKIALEHNKHIFVEKPLAFSVSEVQQLLDLAKSKNKVLMVGHQLRYHPAFIKVQNLVSDGALGEILNITTIRQNFGRIRSEEDVLWNLAPHDISCILAITGFNNLNDITKMNAFGASYVHEGVLDNVDAQLSFKNRVTSNITVSRLRPYKEQKIIIIGTDATVVFDDVQPWDKKIQLYKNKMFINGKEILTTQGNNEYINVEPAEPLYLECQHFLSCIENKSQPITDGLESLAVVGILENMSKIIERNSVEIITHDFTHTQYNIPLAR